MQIFHQNVKTRECKYLDQREINNANDLKAFWNETASKQPLPEGHEWLVCDDTAPQFIYLNNN